MSDEAMSARKQSGADAELVREPGREGVLSARGDWTLANVERLSNQVDALTARADQLDASGISRLDASGALLLERLSAEQDRTRPSPG